MKKVNMEIVDATPAQLQDLVAGNFAARNVHVREHDGEKGIFRYTSEADIYCEATNTICIDGDAIIAKYLHDMDATAGELSLIGIKLADYAAACRRQGWIWFRLGPVPVLSAKVIGKTVVMQLGEPE